MVTGLKSFHHQFSLLFSLVYKTRSVWTDFVHTQSGNGYSTLSPRLAACMKPGEFSLKVNIYIFTFNENSPGFMHAASHGDSVLYPTSTIGYRPTPSQNYILGDTTLTYRVAHSTADFFMFLNSTGEFFIRSILRIFCK